MEKHTSKKLFAGLLALSAGFVLASCDPITATPKNYENAIILTEEGTAVDLKDNIMGKIYDAIANDRNSKIISDLLDEVAIKKFGDYATIDSIFKLDEAGEVVIKDTTKLNTFISDHADAFVREGDIEGEQVNRAKIFYKDVMSRISEFFYNEITSGSYNDDEGRFDEGKLWWAHYYEFYDLGNQTQAEGNQFFVTNKVTKENAFSLLLGKYSKTAETDRGYIEEKVYPQILKDKLVEEYVYNNNFPSLGRAYARKVSYIKVSYEDHVIPWNLLKNFGNDYVEQKNTELDFEVIANSLKGYETVGDFKGTDDGIKPLSETGKAYTLLYKTLIGGEIKTFENVPADKKVVIASDITYNTDTLVKAGTYFKDTKIGEILESYNKALKAEQDGRFANSTDKAELDKFLANGKSKEYGLREKLISLTKEDYTTEGWFVKNGGLSELPSALRDRLFNINVANVLDNPSKLVRETSENLGSYEYKDGDKTKEKLTRLPYVRNIYDKKLIIPAKCQEFSENKYSYIYQDTEGKAFFIVQVLEAPSTPKLNKEQDGSYAKVDTEHPFRTEEIARQVAKVLGTKDSYIKDAYTEYLEKYDFTFYETSLYEHFKAEYPDLFEEE